MPTPTQPTPTINAHGTLYPPTNYKAISDEERMAIWKLSVPHKPPLISSVEIQNITTWTSNVNSGLSVLHPNLMVAADQGRIFGNNFPVDSDVIGVLLLGQKNMPAAFRKERNWDEFREYIESHEGMDMAIAGTERLLNSLKATKDAYAWYINSSARTISGELREDAAAGNTQASSIVANLDKLADADAGKQKKSDARVRSATTKLEEERDHAVTKAQESMALAETLRKEVQELRHQLALLSETRKSPR